MASYTLSDASLQPVEVAELKNLQRRNNEVTYSAAHHTGFATQDFVDRDSKLYGNINAGVS